MIDASEVEGGDSGGRVEGSGEAVVPGWGKQRIGYADEIHSGEKEGREPPASRQRVAQQEQKFPV